MYGELVKRLRERCVFLFPHHGESRSYDADLMHEAADAIETIADEIAKIPSADVVPGSDFRDCRNELCFRCGEYRNRHNGACNGCRWLH